MLRDEIVAAGDPASFPTSFPRRLIEFPSVSISALLGYASLLASYGEITNNRGLRRPSHPERSASGTADLDSSAYDGRLDSLFSNYARAPALSRSSAGSIADTQPDHLTMFFDRTGRDRGRGRNREREGGREE